MYRIAPELRLLIIRGVGVISQFERIQTMRAWLQDPEYPNCTAAICDFSAAESTPTMAEVRELVLLMSRQPPGSGPTKLAMVTPKPITFVVAGEFKQFVEQAGVPIEVRVFERVAEAWEWLHPAGGQAHD